jgi:hypothetical protein
LLRRDELKPPASGGKSHQRVKELKIIGKWRECIAGLLLAAILCIGQAAGGQNSTVGETFKARLTTVPIDLTLTATVAGLGSATAVLTGKHLSVTGTFEGLRSPATTAEIRQAPKGLRGPAILELTVSKATKGTISGSLELTAAQVEDLKNSRLYIQIQSERAPDGNLRGWLLR